MGQGGIDLYMNTTSKKVLLHPIGESENYPKLMLLSLQCPNWSRKRIHNSIATTRASIQQSRFGHLQQLQLLQQVVHAGVGDNGGHMTLY